MLVEKDYLIKQLKEAGIKTQIYTSMKRLNLSNESHLGAVLRGGELFTHSSSKTKFVDEMGIRSVRSKLFDRETKLKVIIADSEEKKCEAILETFIKNLSNGLDVDSNWVGISIGEMEWLEADDSILKAKIAVQFIVTFNGGLYKDSKLVVGKIGNVQTN